jgi:hypothetical protein
MAGQRRRSKAFRLDQGSSAELARHQEAGVDQLVAFGVAHAEGGEGLPLGDEQWAEVGAVRHVAFTLVRSDEGEGAGRTTPEKPP